MKNLKIIFTQIKDFIVSKWKIITYIICSLIILSFVVLAFKLLTNPMNTKVTQCKAQFVHFSRFCVNM